MLPGSIVIENKESFIDRKQFLNASIVIGAGLVFGIKLPVGNSCTNLSAMTNIDKEKDSTNEFSPNAWIRIAEDNTITVIVNHSEMGQGIATALSMIIAEELEADWSKVKFEMAPVATIYENPEFGIQWTVSSMSINGSWDRLRKAGAMVRELMISAASKYWNLPGTDCYAENSCVIHRPSAKKISYGDLIDKVSGVPIPNNVKLKEADEYKLIGKPTLRLDSKEKTDGTAVFGIDVKVPGMLIATVVHPPVFGAKIKRMENTLTKPGIKQVFEISTGVAIVAESFWQGKTAMESLRIEWEENDNNTICIDDLFKRWTEMGKKEGKSFYETGNADDAFKEAENVIEAEYNVPYQAHATPEPMNCTAYVREDSCEIWSPTQNQKCAQDIAAKITGLDNDQVKVNTTFLGGGFGRRALVDYVAEAVEISMKMKAPVKLIWTREQDIKHDAYRAATHNVMKAVVNEKGMPVAWLHRIVGSDVFGQTMPKIVSGMMSDSVPRFIKNIAVSLAGSLMPRFVPGKKAILGAGPLPYRIKNMKVEFINDDPGIPLCWWRSVAHSSNCFAVESFIDEIAAASGKDPYELRLEMLKDNPRLLNVLKLAAEKAEWYQRPPKGICRGIAAHEFQNTMMAMVAEVSVKKSGQVKVHKVTCSVDCGIPINPKTIEAQVQSGIAFGLTATLKSSITVKGGKVQQSNFNDFPLLRMNEMPEVSTFIVPGTDPPTGIGEVAVPLIAPSVTNAIFAATGKRIRKLHITPEDLRS